MNKKTILWGLGIIVVVVGGYFGIKYLTKEKTSNAIGENYGKYEKCVEACAKLTTENERIACIAGCVKNVKGRIAFRPARKEETNNGDHTTSSVR